MEQMHGRFDDEKKILVFRVQTNLTKSSVCVSVCVVYVHAVCPQKAGRGAD